MGVCPFGCTRRSSSQGSGSPRLQSFAASYQNHLGLGMPGQRWRAILPSFTFSPCILRFASSLIPNLSFSCSQHQQVVSSLFPLAFSSFPLLSLFTNLMPSFSPSPTTTSRQATHLDFSFFFCSEIQHLREILFLAGLLTLSFFFSDVASFWPHAGRFVIYIYNIL